jgi:uncharacterized protein (TIGR02444 family)
MSEPEPGEAFWRFSLDFYGREGVAAALLSLQDEAGFDVNLILFALWVGLTGRGRLDAGGLAAAEHAAAPIRRELVEPLRDLRRRLKADPDAAVQALREEVKRLELAAEKIAQSRLAATAGPADGAPARAARLADAAANLALYLGRDSSEAALLRRALAQPAE